VARKKENRKIMEWLTFIEKGFWGGCAAVGFAVLFNVPARALITVFMLGLVGCFLKFSLISFEVNVVLAAFVGASAIGMLSIPAAHSKHAPPLIFSIPAVIPLVPGIFAYRTMLGIMNLTGTIGDNYNQILSETINNGTKASFIIMALAVGVGIPNLITRKDSAKEIGIPISKRRRVKARSLKRKVRK
jgi:uncharacterized membrane protein YjjB (DUF3815 family)